MFWSLWQHLCWLRWQHSQPQHNSCRCTALRGANKPSPPAAGAWAAAWAGCRAFSPLQSYLGSSRESMSEAANILLPLFSEKQGGEGHTACCCLQHHRWGFLPLYFFSIYIRICNIGRVRDGDIPVGHLCQSVEEMAMAQKFWPQAIRGIHPNCNLRSPA